MRRRKLYILSLGHTYLVAQWLRSGRRQQFVRDMMSDTPVRVDLEILYRDEVLPVFQAAGDGEAAGYVATTIDRFSNPFLAYRLADIAQNHTQKLERRVGAFVAWGKSVGIEIFPPRLTLALIALEQQ